MLLKLNYAATLAFSVGITTLASANADLDLVGREPEALSPNSGVSLGMAGGGVAALDGVDAVELNPSMIAQSRQYRVAGNIFWPSYGRSFYKGNVVDSKTNKVAAGLSYVSSQSDFVDYKSLDPKDQKDDYLRAQYDARIKRRVTIALAQSFKYFTLGIQGSHLDGYEEIARRFEKTKVMSFGFGAAALLSRQLRVAGSIQGLGNSDNLELKPPTRQVGLAWLFGSGETSLHIDLKQRRRTKQETIPIDQPKAFGEPTTNSALEKLGEYENMAIISGSAKIQNVLRVYGGYAQEIDGIGRISMGAGAAVVNQGWTLAYSYQIPYLGDSEPTQGLTLGFDMKI